MGFRRVSEAMSVINFSPIRRPSLPITPQIPSRTPVASALIWLWSAEPIRGLAMSAQVLQIRDYQRPEERVACDKRLGFGLLAVPYRHNGVDYWTGPANPSDPLRGIITDLTQLVADTGDCDPRAG